MPAASRSPKARYLNGELHDFFELAAGDLSSALERDLQRPRAELAEALAAEARRLGAPAAVTRNLERLAHPRSMAVVTGQQSGLLLGPGYTLSKAMSALALARELDAEDAPVVPIFWVASQDHDTAEIDHAVILDFDERLHRIHVSLPPERPSGLTEFRPEWNLELVAALRAANPRSEHLASVTALVERASESAETFADHFSSLLYQLLGDQGLIVLDPSRPAVAPFFRAVLAREIEDPTKTVTAIQTAAVRLQELGVEPQLGRGRDATNLFLCEGSGDSLRRSLLRFDGRTFRSDAGEYDAEDLRQILCREPHRLTPAAGLRPVTQDAVLPTAVFVVGPGELGYLAQLKGVYRHHGVAMPLAWPRANVVVLEPPVQRILERFGVDYWRYAFERQALLERMLLDRGGHSQAFDDALQELQDVTRRLLEHVRLIDPTLQRPVERGQQRLQATVEGLRRKAGHALLRGDETLRRQQERLEAHLFPGGAPQERVISPFSYFLKFGVEPMMRHYRTVGAAGDHLLEP